MGDNVAMIKGGNCDTDAIHVSKDHICHAQDREYCVCFTPECPSPSCAMNSQPHPKTGAEYAVLPFQVKPNTSGIQKTQHES